MKPVLVDLFCGAGGATAGYQQAGFTVLGVDIEPQPNYCGDAFTQGDVLELDLRGLVRETGAVAAHASPPCFPAGTPVVAARGVVPIESVVVGESVLTHEGRWRTVTATMSRTAPVVADKWLATTADHPFLTRMRRRGSGQHVEWSRPEWTTAGEMHGRFVAIPASADPLAVPDILGRPVSITPCFWYMVGRWLGDGWVRRVKADPDAPRRPHGRLFTEPQVCPSCGGQSARNRRWNHLWNAYCSRICSQRHGRANRVMTRGDVIICSSNEEADGLHSKLQETGLAWGWTHERTTTRFVAAHVGLADWLTEHFGRYAHGKTLPGWLFGLSEGDRRALLDGYLDADGYITQSGFGANTVSPMLAVGVRVLAAGLGFDTSLTVGSPSRAVVTIEGRSSVERPLWRLKLSGRRYGFLDGKHWWGRRRAELSPRGEESVYDLTVDEDHSFVAWGFVVHNCQHYSPLAAYHGDRGRYPDLVASVRDMLVETGVPYVIENVPQAPLRNPLLLCGAMFNGLRVYRHRCFELSFDGVWSPPHPAHRVRCVRNGYLPTDGQFMSIHGGKHSKAWQRKAAEVMGTPWMTTIPEVCESIPPLFTRHIGSQLISLRWPECAA